MGDRLYSYAQWQYYAYREFIIADGKIFFINCRNLPIRLDIQTGTAEIISGIKGYSRVLELDIMEKVVQTNGKIYAFEAKSEHMVIYDPEKNCCQCRELNFHHDEWSNALSVTPYDENIYIFPKYRDFILKIDTNTDQVFKITSPAYEHMDRNVSAGADDGKVYFFLRNGSKVTEYDLCTGQCRECCLPYELGDIICVQFFEGLFYLMSKDGGLWVWNAEVNELETLLTPFIKKGTNPNSFYLCTITDKNIWLFPDLGEDIYIYYRETGKLEKYDGYPEGFAYLLTDNWGKFISNREYHGKYYHDMHSANCILCIDKHSGQEKWIRPSVPGRTEECLYYIKNGCNVILKETELPLEKFIEAVGKV